MTNSMDLLVTLNDEIEVLIETYQDIPVSDLLEQMDISAVAKNSLNALTKRLIAYANVSALSRLEAEKQLKFKTIKLDRYGRLKESMSFPSFKYCDLVNESWEESSLRKIFYDTIFAFTIFQNEGKQSYLKKIVLWQMPLEILDNGVRQVWENTKNCIQTGNIVKYIDDNGRYFTYFPASTENPYVHVRPHARDREDTNPLPIPDKLTGFTCYPKHCFWLNRSYILKIISREGML